MRRPAAEQLHRVENTDFVEEDHTSGNVIYTNECIGVVRSRGKTWFLTLQLHNKL